MDAVPIILSTLEYPTPNVTAPVGLFLDQDVHVNLVPAGTLGLRHGNVLEITQPFKIIFYSF